VALLESVTSRVTLGESEAVEVSLTMKVGTLEAVGSSHTLGVGVEERHRVGLLECVLETVGVPLLRGVPDLAREEEELALALRLTRRDVLGLEDALMQLDALEEAVREAVGQGLAEAVREGSEVKLPRSKGEVEEVREK